VKKQTPAKKLLASCQGIKDHCDNKSNDLKPRGGFSAAYAYEDIASRLKEAITTYLKESQATKTK